MEIMQKIERTHVMKPVELTVADQIEGALENASHLGAVILIPDGDIGLKYLYRGSGGAWWRGRYNEPGVSINLHAELNDVEQAVLITREEVNGILEERVFLHEPGKDC